MSDDQQPTHEPLPQEHVDKLSDTFMAGFRSGIATYLLQRHQCTDQECPVNALAYTVACRLADRAFEDPAFRLQLGIDLEHKWHDPDWKPEHAVITSHGRST